MKEALPHSADLAKVSDDSKHLVRVSKSAPPHRIHFVYNRGGLRKLRVFAPKIKERQFRGVI